jgi:hypothetical protein
MLHAGAEPGRQQQHQQRREASGPAGGHEADGRDGGAECQEPALAEALGQEAGRDLERRHAAGVRGADQSDLRERQAELAGPERQEHVERLGESVVQEVDGGCGGEHRPGPALHATIIPGDPPRFKSSRFK